MYRYICALIYFGGKFKATPYENYNAGCGANFLSDNTKIPKEYFGVSNKFRAE